MDWLGQRQARIETARARRHLQAGTLVLYDVSSSYLEGRCCPLGRRGHSRDGKKGKLQIVYGLLCNAEGCPVAVEVYAGNTGDPATHADQIRKVRTRFGLERVVFVGDRGMLTSARINEELRPVEGLDWVSALRSNEIARAPAGRLGTFTSALSGSFHPALTMGKHFGWESRTAAGCATGATRNGSTPRRASTAST